MRAVKPVIITSEKLISSNIPDTTLLEWNAATVYSVGNQVTRSATHCIYTCLIAGSNSTPPEDSALLSTPRWADNGPTNRWAMFDNEVNTESTRTAPMVIVIKPGIINALALININAVSVSVSMAVGGQVVYSASKNLDMSEITDWYQYFFGGFNMIHQAVFSDIPPYASAEITITIYGDSSVSVGGIIAGNTYYIGKTQYVPSIEITDYSVKSTDEYGVTRFKVRKSAKRMECSLLVSNDRIDAVFSLVDSLRGGPSLWIGSDDFRLGLMTVFGWYSSFTVTLKYSKNSICTTQIQGLT